MGGIVDFWKKYQLKPMKALLKTTTLGGNPMANLAIGAALVGGGTLLPGLLGAGAAGAGAAGAGAAGAGAGLMGGGTAASMFGPTAAQAGLLGTYAAPAAATPFFTGAAATPALSASMFGPTAAGAESLAALAGPGAGMGSGMNWMKALQVAGKMGNAMGEEKKPQVQPAPMPQVQPYAGASTEEIMKRIYHLMYGGNYV